MAGFFAFPQGEDSSDFVEAETESLSFLDETKFLERPLVVRAVTTICPRCARKEAGPFVESNGVSLHSRRLRELPDQILLLLGLHFSAPKQLCLRLRDAAFEGDMAVDDNRRNLRDSMPLRRLALLISFAATFDDLTAAG